jgi:hypothetical protein
MTFVPQLRSLQTHMLAGMLIIPWEQLEDLHLSWVSWDGCLLRCPNVVECEIYPCDDEDPRTPFSCSAHLPQLTKFKFEAQGDGSAENLFHSLVTPMLSDLRV